MPHVCKLGACAYCKLNVVKSFGGVRCAVIKGKISYSYTQYEYNILVITQVQDKAKNAGNN